MQHNCTKSYPGWILILSNAQQSQDCCTISRLHWIPMLYFLALAIKKLYEVKMEHLVSPVQRRLVQWYSCSVVRAQLVQDRETLGLIHSNYWLFHFPPSLPRTIIKVCLCVCLCSCYILTSFGTTTSSNVMPHVLDAR